MRLPTPTKQAGSGNVPDPALPRDAAPGWGKNQYLQALRQTENLIQQLLRLENQLKRLVLVDPMPLEGGAFEHRNHLRRQVIALRGKGGKLALQIAVCAVVGSVAFQRDR